MQAKSGAVDLIRSELVSHQASPATVKQALNGIAREHRDTWLDQLWGINVPEDTSDLPRGCVPYLPCPVATVLDAIEQAEVTSSDVFVDIGAGVGRAVFLTHMLTGAECIGVEIQHALVRLAIARAKRLRLERMRFIEGDAQDRIPLTSAGTVFFLYCPFSGVRLDSFLDALEGIARTRLARICCVDMPRLDRDWLTLIAARSAELHVYQSKSLGVAKSTSSAAAG